MHRKGWTLIELLAVIFIVATTMIAWESVKSSYGVWWGIGAGLLVGVLSVIFVYNIYRLSWRRSERILAELRDKYTWIYQVKTVPSDPKVIIMPEGAEIRIGDFGWEAGPIRDDGLVYLQGLTPEWTVVWHVGFRPDEIEKVVEKPDSQYDFWRPYWVDPALLPPCPFPVVERKTMTIGHPHYSHDYFVEPALYHPGKTMTEAPDEDTT
jgi:hypothetical protein